MRPNSSPPGPTTRSFEIGMGLTYVIFRASECDSLPLLKLLGKAFDINVTNARLYIKSLEKKIVEIVDVLKIDEVS